MVDSAPNQIRSRVGVHDLKPLIPPVQVGAPAATARANGNRGEGRRGDLIRLEGREP